MALAQQPCCQNNTGLVQVQALLLQLHSVKQQVLAPKHHPDAVTSASDIAASALLMETRSHGLPLPSA